VWRFLLLAFGSRGEQWRPTLKRTLWRARRGPRGVCEGTDGEAAQKRLSVEGVEPGFSGGVVGVLCAATMGFPSSLGETFVKGATTGSDISSGSLSDTSAVASSMTLRVTRQFRGGRCSGGSGSKDPHESHVRR
jgi:hypothetical protein